LPACRLAVVAAAMIGLTAGVPTGAEAQVNAKWVTVVMPAEPPNLDGCMSASTLQGTVLRQNVIETLIQKAADAELKPKLATSWERIDDTTWRFKLRHGVTFHDGSAFNAATAKTSIDRTMTKSMACSDMTKGFADLKIEVAVVDDDTLTIKTSRPDAILPTRMAGVGIYGPKTAPDKMVLDAVGTGPYKFDTWQAGVQILLKRNDKYWGAAPQPEGARYLWRSDSAVRAAMVKIGEADIGHAIASVDATDPVLDHSYLSSETNYIRIDTLKPPLSDKRVRLALNYATDRKTPIGTIMPKGTLPATQIVFPFIPGHNNEIDKNPYPYDPAKAKQLLAEAKAAGVPVDTQILMVSYPAQYANAAELMETMYSMFTAVGFNIKLITVDPAGWREFQSKPFKEDRQPLLFQSSHDNNSGDPVFSIDKFACYGSSSMLCDQHYDDLVAKATALSGDERVKAWQELFRYAYEDAVPAVFLYHLLGYTRVGPRINWTPDTSTNQEIRIAEITFKK
jgi:peptide/nickel transport system substrate-binding protein